MCEGEGGGSFDPEFERYRSPNTLKKLHTAHNDVGEVNCGRESASNSVTEFMNDRLSFMRAVSRYQQFLIFNGRCKLTALCHLFLEWMCRT